MSQLTLEEWRLLPSARSIALGFLSTARGPMRVATLVHRAEVVGIDGATLRVALGRLCRDGIVTQVERGLYAIGPGGAALDSRARSWADAPRRVRPWQGRWAIVAVNHLGRSDRRQLRLRERALALHGFVPTDTGFWIRPDNLAQSLFDLAAQLRAIGLDEDATVLGEVLPLDDTPWRALWPAQAIEAGYRFWIAQMTESLARLPTLSHTAAARETLLLGQSVIRAINRDPLLPDALVDTNVRDAMVAAMRDYDRVGKSYWATISLA